MYPQFVHYDIDLDLLECSDLWHIAPALLLYFIIKPFFPFCIILCNLSLYIDRPCKRSIKLLWYTTCHSTSNLSIWLSCIVFGNAFDYDVCDKLNWRTDETDKSTFQCILLFTISQEIMLK